MPKAIAGFLQHLERMMSIHIKKGEDYATKQDPLLNYHRQSIISSWFNREQDKVYATHIGQKLARLANLLNKEFEADEAGADKPTPNIEPVDDSFLDLTTIGTIWFCDWSNGYRAQLVDLPVAGERGSPAISEGEIQSRQAAYREAGERSAVSAITPEKIDEALRVLEAAPILIMRQRDWLLKICRHFHL